MREVDFSLYLVSDRSLVGGTGELISAIEAALMGGVRAVQLREKDMGAAGLFSLAARLRELTSRYGAKFFVNDRLDVAIAAGADGIHLGQASFSAGNARGFLSSIDKDMTIGVSTHSVNEAKRAEADGADFVTFGPVYETPSKLAYGPALGVGSLKEAVAELSIPVFAIGGVKRHGLGELFGAGAKGVALISGILGARDITGEAKGFVSALNKEKERYDDQIR